MSSYSLLPASFSNIGCFLLGTVVVLYFIRLRLLPNPIPNIPHNKAAANSIWGDAPEMMADMSATGEMMEWLLSQHNRHNSSVVQIFARPFSKPWVMINDFQESQDILMRRTKEFDRSAFFGDVFVGLNPNHHISKSSQDPHFKRNRALLKDLMTPVFLHDVGFNLLCSTAICGLLIMLSGRSTRYLQYIFDVDPLVDQEDGNWARSSLRSRRGHLPRCS